MKFHNYLNFFSFYFKKHKINLFIGGFLIFLLSILILPTPLITRHIVDITLPNKNIHELFLLLLLIFVLLVIIKLIIYFQEIIFFKINNKVILDIRLDLLDKINKLPFKLSKKYGTGYLISRINDDTERLRTLFVDTILSIIKDILTFIAGLTAVFFINSKLAVISISILPFFAGASIYFSLKIRKLSKIYFEDSAQTTRSLEESLNSIELIKIFLRYKFNLLHYYKISYL